MSVGEPGTPAALRGSDSLQCGNRAVIEHRMIERAGIEDQAVGICRAGN